MADVKANYHAIRRRIAEAAGRSHRDPAEVRLLAAAKSQSCAAIEQAISAGVGLIGENYVQEAKAKRTALSAPIEWHMIGHLQRNKARLGVELFDVIETLDSSALARELDKEGRRRGEAVRALVEVNLAAEAGKSGVSENGARDLLKLLGDLSYLRVEGLMTVPPFKEHPDQVRPYFRRLRELKLELAALDTPNVELKELSMGMSHDFAVAIEEGSTIVRIGTALFGPRSTQG